MNVKSPKAGVPAAPSASPLQTSTTPPAKPTAPDSSFTAATAAAVKEPAAEFPNRDTKVGEFVASTWQPLIGALGAYDSGGLQPTPLGGVQVISVAADQISADLSRFLSRVDVNQEIRATSFEGVVEPFLRQYGIASYDDLRIHELDNNPGQMRLPRSPEANPIYGVAKQMALTAERDPAYGALLEHVKRDPLTLLMLLAGHDRYEAPWAINPDGPRLAPHEKALVADLIDLKMAQQKLALNRTELSPVERAALSTPHGIMEGELAHAASDGLEQLRHARLPHKRERLASALEGLSLQKPPYRD